MAIWRKRAAAVENLENEIMARIKSKIPNSKNDLAPIREVIMSAEQIFTNILEQLGFSADVKVRSQNLSLKRLYFMVHFFTFSADVDSFVIL